MTQCSYCHNELRGMIYADSGLLVCKPCHFDKPRVFLAYRQYFGDAIWFCVSKETMGQGYDHISAYNDWRRQWGLLHAFD